MHTQSFKSISHYYDPYVTFSDCIFFRCFNFLSIGSNSGPNTIYELTYEQHGFELSKSTRMWIFFPINTCAVFDPWLEIRGCTGPTGFAVLPHFKEVTSASMDFGIYRSPGTNPLRKLADNVSFEGVKSYTRIFNCAAVGTPKPHVVQRSKLCNRQPMVHIL